MSRRRMMMALSDGRLPIPSNQIWFEGHFIENCFDDATKFGDDIEFLGVTTNGNIKIANFSDPITRISKISAINRRMKKCWMPDTVTYINYTFCEAFLEFCQFSKNLTRIGKFTFNYCFQGQDFVLPSSVTVLESEAFRQAYFKTFVFPADSNIVSCGTFVFCHCDYLETIISYPLTPPPLSSYSFSNCSSLTHIYVPAAAVDTYKAAPVWSYYASIISAITE